MKKLALLSVFALLPLLAACTAADMAPEGMVSPKTLEPVRHNIAVQLVNPQAPQGEEAPAMNGERAALAQDAYAHDQVKQPPSVMVTSGSGSSGGGSGTSSGTTK